ncbi:MAG: NADH-quinone oxidoreductase subunit B family protein [Thermofilaceae archaeon]|nr:NADH-quinone oxidoreductase subunit B family protein [Thermofilaceae archaeon]MCX8180721.1 NADH-quinone oxidoreductase subunit B family protein [Thermofilaceae archaeon]
MLVKIANWAKARSLWLLFINTGACNACDIEVLAALSPRYDAERFGVLLKGSPRHADVLLVTGPVTRQVKNRLIRIYEQIPHPKFVVAVGTCTASGGVYDNCYNVYEGLDKVLPVNLYIPGCPVRPEAVLDAMKLLREKLARGEIH